MNEAGYSWLLQSGLVDRRIVHLPSQGDDAKNRFGAGLAAAVVRMETSLEIFQITVCPSKQIIFDKGSKYPVPVTGHLVSGTAAAVVAHLVFRCLAR